MIFFLPLNPSEKDTEKADDKSGQTTTKGDIVDSAGMKPGKISLEIVAEGDEFSNGSTSTKDDENDVTPMEVVAQNAAEPDIQKAIVNFEEGLSDLMKISQSFKTIDEEHSEAKDKPSTSGKNSMHWYTFSFL